MSGQRPLVSVVTSVYNGARYLRGSLESVLSQQGVDLELVVIDDGCTDEGPRILSELAARDSRVRVLSQENRGMTAALVRGCQEARGVYIARHDADDVSLPGRLAKQVDRLERDKGTVLVATDSRTIGPNDELLYDSIGPSEAEAAGLLRSGVRSLGPHGAHMFRRESYKRVGGYRLPFRYAQDWDLWLRLLEVGAAGLVPEVLYGYRVHVTSISSARRTQQGRLHDLALQCQEARATGRPEDALLEEAARVSSGIPVGAREQVASASYFIGRCLLDRRDRRAVGYLASSVRAAPLRWRGWVALLGALLVCHGGPGTLPDKASTGVS